MKRKLLRYAVLLTAFLLLFGGGSCMKKDDTPVTSITDALKIKAYVYDESGETWNLEQLRLNEPKQLVPIHIFNGYEGLDMNNFNLHFEYELATVLHQIYLSMKKSLRDGILDNNKELLIGVKNNLGKLRDAYDEIVTADESAPVMSHTQSVVAGLTYGRNSLNENLTDAGSDRGFRV